MFTGIASFIGVLLLGFCLDWLVCTRIAAYRVDYEYSYRPHRLRYGIIALAAAEFAYVNATHDPSRPPIVGLFILLGILSAWGIVALRDVRRELIPSELVPKRYAEGDD